MHQTCKSRRDVGRVVVNECLHRVTHAQADLLLLAVERLFQDIAAVAVGREIDDAATHASDNLATLLRTSSGLKATVDRLVAETMIISPPRAQMASTMRPRSLGPATWSFYCRKIDSCWSARSFLSLLPRPVPSHCQ